MWVILLKKAKSKIPDVSNLATKTALTTVENKIPDVDLVCDWVIWLTLGKSKIISHFADFGQTKKISQILLLWASQKIKY